MASSHPTTAAFAVVVQKETRKGPCGNSMSTLVSLMTSTWSVLHVAVLSVTFTKGIMNVELSDDVMEVLVIMRNS